MMIIMICGLACAKRPLQLGERPWVEVRTSRVRLLGDVDPALLVRLGRNLELFRLYLLKTGIARWPDHIAPVTIFVVGRRYTFGPLRPESNVEGWFAPTIRGSYAAVNLDAGFDEEGPDQNVLLHEFAHLLLAYNDGYRYPKWYEEGFAESLSTFSVDEKGGVDVGLPSKSRIRELAKQWIPLRQLFEDLPVDYPQAWLTVHYLSSAPGRFEQLMEYLTLYDLGAASDEAFTKAFDLDYRELGAEIRKYYWSGEYSYVHFEPGELGVVDAPVVRTMSESEVLVDLGILFLDARGDLDTATAFFERALQLEPTNARARSGLAASALAVDDLATAATQIDAARAIGPNDAWAHTLRGQWLVLSAADGSNASSTTRAEILAEARSEFLRAIELDGRIPEPHWALGITYEGESGSSDTAIHWLESARQLQPLDPRISLDLAALRIERKELAKARQILEPLIRAHDGSLRDEALALLRDLERAEGPMDSVK